MCWSTTSIASDKKRRRSACVRWAQSRKHVKFSEASRLKRRKRMLESGTDHPGGNAQQATDEDNIYIGQTLRGQEGEPGESWKEADQIDRTVQPRQTENQKQNQQERTGQGGNGR
ncbi:hypothetical protein VPH35_020277 [Triticum aestivum]|uniref:Uncharacterized protein n=1 Tax=Triticum urartu TaxID=4572 RepID=A0A8R7PCJ7_TRIUA